MSRDATCGRGKVTKKGQTIMRQTRPKYLPGPSASTLPFEIFRAGSGPEDGCICQVAWKSVEKFRGCGVEYWPLSFTWPRSYTTACLIVQPRTTTVQAVMRLLAMVVIVRNAAW